MHPKLGINRSSNHFKKSKSKHDLVTHGFNLFRRRYRTDIIQKWSNFLLL